MPPKTPRHGTPKPKKSFSSSGKISKQLFKPYSKKVSFGPSIDLSQEKERQIKEKERELQEREKKIMEREKMALEQEKNKELDERERKILEREKKVTEMEKNIASATPSDLRTSGRTSINGKRKVPSTPHPSTSKQSKMSRVSVINSAKEDDHQKKRRKVKRSSYTLFPNTTVVKSRPSNTLTAQLNYALEILPSKIHALKVDTKLCFATRINELEKLEGNLLKRLETVSSLKLKNSDNELNDKKYEVLEEMEEKILTLQTYRESKGVELQLVRPQLRTNHSERFVCCPVCAKKKTNR